MARMRCKRKREDRACEKHYRFNTSVRYPLSGSILGIFREVYYGNEDDGRRTGLSAMKRQIETEAGGRSGADTRCKVYEIKAPVKTADSTRASYSPFVSPIVIGTSIFLRNLLLLRERREPVYRKRSRRGKQTRGDENERGKDEESCKKSQIRHVPRVVEFLSKSIAQLFNIHAQFYISDNLIQLQSLAILNF